MSTSQALDAVGGGSSEDRSRLWLPFLQRLPEVSNLYAVRGNLEEGLTGTGDIDILAPMSDWPQLEREFREWAAEHGLGPVVVCRHVLDGVVLIAVGRPGSVFFEVEARGSRYFRGGELFDPASVRRLTKVDERGFRIIRPGAEAVFMLVLNGFGRRGRPRRRRIEANQLPQLLRSDPDGAREAARLFGLAEGGSPPCRCGGCGRHMGPAAGARRGGVGTDPLPEGPGDARAPGPRKATEKRCIIRRTIAEQDRRVPADREAWLRAVAESHAVYHDAPRL